MSVLSRRKICIVAVTAGFTSTCCDSPIRVHPMNILHSNIVQCKPNSLRIARTKELRIIRPLHCSSQRNTILGVIFEVQIAFRSSREYANCSLNHGGTASAFRFAPVKGEGKTRCFGTIHLFTLSTTAKCKGTFLGSVTSLPFTQTTRPLYVHRYCVYSLAVVSASVPAARVVAVELYSTFHMPLRSSRGSFL